MSTILKMWARFLKDLQSNVGENMAVSESKVQTVLQTNLPLPIIGRGKVRDIYAVGDDKLLIVTTDRLSAFDVVLPDPIPNKGRVLTQINRASP